MKILLPKIRSYTSVVNRQRWVCHLFKCTLIGMLFVLASTTAFAQRQVNGKVTGAADNAAIPGVTVLVKGTTNATSTDAGGNYSIEVPNDQSTLAFSFIGFQPQEVVVGNQTTINVVLEEDAQALDELVVIGYGTQKRSDLTGAVGSVSEVELEKLPAASLNQKLAGKMPGVQVNTNSGRPGGQTTIRIRGFSSINTTSNPLYVVDGVMLPVGTQTQMTNAIDFINPNDIASVEVLKDASATAIYGARGANGVILITTKRGQPGEGRITYDADFSVPTIGPNRPEVLNAREFLAVEDLAYQNIQKYDPVGWAEGKYAFRDPALARTDPRLFDSNGNPYYDTDWLKELTQNKLSQNHQLGFTGGDADNQYGIFVGYQDQNGLLQNSYLKRYSARFNFDSQIKKWIKIGGSLSYNNQKENLVVFNNGGGVERLIIESFPFLPVKYSDGTWAANRDYLNAEQFRNALANLTERQHTINSQTTLGNIYSNITLTKDLEMRTVLGANILTQEVNEFRSRYLAENQKGIADISNSQLSFWSLEIVLK